MATALKFNKKSGHVLSFSHKLFLSVISLFLVFAGCFIAYQYQREKEYKIELLDTQLQDYNERLALELQMAPDSIKKFIMHHYASQYRDRQLRVTVIAHNGDVIYDSYRNGKSRPDNHLSRPEIQKALKHGRGYDLRRTSETTGVNYFYSATDCSQYIIRSALPYNVNLANHLAADPHYLWFTGITTLLLLFIFRNLTSRLGKAIGHLRQFASRADRNEPIEMDIQSAFPHNELGEISQHIIQIYKRLRETKEALYIEREKLITHLQTSREGLGVFTREKKEILVNDLFLQYANLLSDTNLHTTEQIFSIPELNPIRLFIDSAQERHAVDTEEMRTTLNLHKNGRTFLIKCNVFQDFSFEISINDITQEEEQMILKRQLTQNIAHELKTPVSSIQGYLETIVNTPGISPEKQEMFLDRCYAQSNRLSHLLRDISLLTRMDEAAGMMDMERTDISQLVKNIFNEVTLQLEERKMSIDNRLRPDIVLQGNYSLLYSIFRNLTDNAIAYAGPHTTITIDCFREDERFFYFNFADNGTGVPPEHLNRLFERFYRVDKGRSRKMGGTGLGLAIVKNAVLIHNGTISAKNAAGGGLSFIFTLAKRK